MTVTTDHLERGVLPPLVPLQADLGRAGAPPVAPALPSTSRTLTSVPDGFPGLGDPVEANDWQMRDLWQHIEPTITCWLWRGLIDDEGYGKYAGRGAHVVLFERLIGKVPAGLELDHTCRNRPCVNPGHMEPVTPLENQRRSRVARFVDWLPDTCRAAGHEMTDENTYIRPSDGGRRCRACARGGGRSRRSEPVAALPGRSSA